MRKWPSLHPRNWVVIVSGWARFLACLGTRTEMISLPVLWIQDNDSRYTDTAVTLAILTMTLAILSVVTLAILRVVTLASQRVSGRLTPAMTHLCDIHGVPDFWGEVECLGYC